MLKQISPPSHQMIEDRLLVRQQPVMTGYSLVDLGEPGISPNRSAKALR